MQRHVRRWLRGPSLHRLGRLNLGGLGLALAVAFGTMLLFQMLVRASDLPYRMRPSTWREVSRVTALVGLIVAVQFILAGVYTA